MYNTLDSNAVPSTLGEGVFGDLTDLTLIAEEFGQEPDSEFSSSLIEYGRFLEVAEDCEIRLGSPDAKPFSGRFYLLNDLILIGKYRHHGQSKRTLSTAGNNGEKIIFGAGNFDTLSNSESGESKGSKSKHALKLKLWVDLAGVQVRDINKESGHGIRIIFTTKESVENEDGTLQIITNVEQTEVYFVDEDTMLHFASKVHDTIDSLLEKQLKNDLNTMTISAVEEDTNSDAGSEPSMSTSASHKKRSYGAAKATMRKLQKARNNKSSGTMSKEDGEPFSLQDLESRYKVSLQPKAQSDMAEFSVSFKQGSMGFALSSSDAASGVFVGKLEENGMADSGGVTLGDRVIQIGDVSITSDFDWKMCRDLIMQKRKEIDSNGKPMPLVVKFARVKAVEENITKMNEENKLKEKKERALRARKKRGGKRAWMDSKKKNKSFGSRLENIKDLEKKYLRAGENEKTQDTVEKVFETLLSLASDKQEGECVHILKEIHDTEKSYVQSLYALKDNYIKKLGKKDVTVSCKEYGLTANVKFCEHGTPASVCKLQSSHKQKLMTKEDLKGVFTNVEVLIKINENLLADLQHGVEDLEKLGQKVAIGDVVSVYAPAFTKIMPFYMMYSQYAANYSKALDKLAELKLNETFRRELNAIESAKDVESLQSLMIKPISRLCKYPLLFDTLSDKMRPVLKKVALEASKTGKGDMDKLSKLVDDLEQTRKMVSKIAESVDFKVGEENKQQVMKDIYNELGGVTYIKEFFVPSRKFTDRFDDVVLEEKKGNKTVQKKNCLVYVFNDLVIFGKYSKSAAGGKGTLHPNNTLQDKSFNVNSSKRSVASKNSMDQNSMIGSKTGSKVGLLSKMASKVSGSPAVKIEVGGEPIDLKNIKIKAAQDTEPNKFAANVFVTVKADAKEKKGPQRKNSKTDTLVPGINKVSVIFSNAADRDRLVTCVSQNLTKLVEAESTRKEAKVQMGHARLRMKEKRKQIMNRGAVASSSSNRQETLKAKLAERKASKLKEQPIPS